MQESEGHWIAQRIAERIPDCGRQEDWETPWLPDREQEQAWCEHEAAEAVIADHGVKVEHLRGTERARYHVREDRIEMPMRYQFRSALRFYNTMFHELAHATSHVDRICRHRMAQCQADGWGSPAYAREEIVAEVAAAITCERLGIGLDVEQHAIYMREWLSSFEGEPDEVVSLGIEARIVSDYLLAKHCEREAAN